MPKHPTQTLNYNHITRDEIKSEDISFQFLKGNTALQMLNKVQHVYPLSVNASSQSKSTFSVDDEHSDESGELN